MTDVENNNAFLSGYHGGLKSNVLLNNYRNVQIILLIQIA